MDGYCRPRGGWMLLALKARTETETAAEVSGSARRSLSERTLRLPVGLGEEMRLVASQSGSKGRGGGVERERRGGARRRADASGGGRASERGARCSLGACPLTRGGERATQKPVDRPALVALRLRRKASSRADRGRGGVDRVCGWPDPCWGEPSGCGCGAEGRRA
eukprot:2779866-Rhodomonas_salina.11